MLHSFAHPSIERMPVEEKRSTLPREWNLASAHAVVKGVLAHAEIPRGVLHIEIAGLDDRSLGNVS
jgi:hypothetical protein